MRTGTRTGLLAGGMASLGLALGATGAAAGQPPPERVIIIGTFDQGDSACGFPPFNDDFTATPLPPGGPAGFTIEQPSTGDAGTFLMAEDGSMRFEPEGDEAYTVEDHTPSSLFGDYSYTSDGCTQTYRFHFDTPPGWVAETFFSFYGPPTSPVLMDSCTGTSHFFGPITDPVTGDTYDPPSIWVFAGSIVGLEPGTVVQLVAAGASGEQLVHGVVDDQGRVFVQVPAFQYGEHPFALAVDDAVFAEGVHVIDDAEPTCTVEQLVTFTITDLTPPSVEPPDEEPPSVDDPTDEPTPTPEPTSTPDDGSGVPWAPIAAGGALLTAGGVALTVRDRRDRPFHSGFSEPEGAGSSLTEEDLRQYNAPGALTVMTTPEERAADAALALDRVQDGWRLITQRERAVEDRVRDDFVALRTAAGGSLQAYQTAVSDFTQNYVKAMSGTTVFDGMLVEGAEAVRTGQVCDLVWAIGQLVHGGYRLASAKWFAKAPVPGGAQLAAGTADDFARRYFDLLETQRGIAMQRLATEAGVDLAAWVARFDNLDDAGTALVSTVAQARGWVPMSNDAQLTVRRVLDALSSNLSIEGMVIRADDLAAIRRWADSVPDFWGKLGKAADWFETTGWEGRLPEAIRSLELLFQPDDIVRLRALIESGWAPATTAARAADDAPTLAGGLLHGLDAADGTPTLVGGLGSATGTAGAADITPTILTGLGQGTDAGAATVRLPAGYVDDVFGLGALDDTSRWVPGALEETAGWAPGIVDDALRVPMTPPAGPAGAAGALDGTAAWSPSTLGETANWPGPLGALDETAGWTPGSGLLPPDAVPTRLLPPGWLDDVLPTRTLPADGPPMTIGGQLPRQGVGGSGGFGGVDDVGTLRLPGAAADATPTLHLPVPPAVSPARIPHAGPPVAPMPGPSGAPAPVAGGGPAPGELAWRALVGTQEAWNVLNHVATGTTILQNAVNPPVSSPRPDLADQARQCGIDPDLFLCSLPGEHLGSAPDALLGRVGDRCGWHELPPDAGLLLERCLSEVNGGIAGGSGGCLDPGDLSELSRLTTTPGFASWLDTCYVQDEQTVCFPFSGDDAHVLETLTCAGGDFNTTAQLLGPVRCSAIEVQADLAAGTGTAGAAPAAPFGQFPAPAVPAPRAQPLFEGQGLDRQRFHQQIGTYLRGSTSSGMMGLGSVPDTLANGLDEKTSEFHFAFWTFDNAALATFWTAFSSPFETMASAYYSGSAYRELGRYMEDFKTELGNMSAAYTDGIQALDSLIRALDGQVDDTDPLGRAPGELGQILADYERYWAQAPEEWRQKVKPEFEFRRFHLGQKISDIQRSLAPLRSLLTQLRGLRDWLQSMRDSQSPGQGTLWLVSPWVWMRLAGAGVQANELATASFLQGGRPQPQLPVVQQPVLDIDAVMDASRAEAARLEAMSDDEADAYWHEQYGDVDVDDGELGEFLRNLRDGGGLEEDG